MKSAAEVCLKGKIRYRFGEPVHKRQVVEDSPSDESEASRENAICRLQESVGSFRFFFFLKEIAGALLFH